MMRAAVLTGPGRLEMQSIPDLPPPGEYQALCRNRWFAACTGTDRKLLEDRTPWGGIAYPSILGHESVGEVVEIGAKVRHLAPGDVVLRPVYGYAGTRVNGFGNDFGGFSCHGVVTDFEAMLEDGREDFPEYSRYQLPVPRSWGGSSATVMLITMKETLSFMAQLPSCRHRRVAIIGAGAVGMFCCHWAALQAPLRLTVFARSRRAAERVGSVGADALEVLNYGQLPEREYDLVVDAAGVMEHLEQLRHMVAPGGCFAVYGLSSTPTCSFAGFGSGITVAFPNPDESNPVWHSTCIRMVERGTVDLHRFHSATYRFEQLPEGFADIAAGTEFKPVFAAE